MSTKRFTGQLLDPIDQTPDVGASLRFTSLEVVGDMVPGAVSVVDLAPPFAEYDFTLNYGKYQVEYTTCVDEQYRTVGVVFVASDTIADNIPDLLGATFVTTDAGVLEMQGLRDAAQQSADAAKASEDTAKLYAETASNGLVAKGDWDASSGNFPTPTLAPERADFYQISVGGVMSDGAQGDVEVKVGDQLYWHMDKDVWYKIDNTDLVISVNGQQGVVVIDTNGEAIATNTQAITTNTQAIAEITQTIAEITQAIAEITQAITTNTQAIAEITQAIAEINMYPTPWVFIGEAGAPAFENGVSAHNKTNGLKYRFIDAQTIHCIGTAWHSNFPDNTTTTCFTFPTAIANRVLNTQLAPASGNNSAEGEVFSEVTTSGRFSVHTSTGTSSWVMVNHTLLLDV